MKTTITQAIIYVRYSPRPTKKHGRVLQCESNEDQEAECRALCTARGWPIAAVYSDSRKSGGDGLERRPGLADAIAALRPGWCWFATAPTDWPATRSSRK